MQFRALDGADLEVSGDGRTVAGILVPYNRATVITPQLTEEFLPGSFARQVKAFEAAQGRGGPRIPFARGHLGANGTLGGQAVGRVTALREDTAGLYGEARVSETPAGDELLTLLRDGVYEELSIGFMPGQDLQAPGGVVQRRTATLTELAVVLAGAYGPAAKVLAVRSQDCPTCGRASGADVTDQARALAEELRAANPNYGRGSK